MRDNLDIGRRIEYESDNNGKIYRGQIIGRAKADARFLVQWDDGYKSLMDETLIRPEE